MSSIVAIVLIILILGVIFFVVATKFRRVDSEVRTPIVSAKFKASNQENYALFGKAEVKDVEGQNVTLGDITGLEGESSGTGTASVIDIKAKEDVDIKSVTGSRGIKPNK